MKRYHIDVAKCEEGKKLLTCNPPPMYANVASVKYTAEATSGWLHCVEVLGFHEFYCAEESLHDKLVEMNDEDEPYLEKMHIDDFDGLDLEQFVEGYGPEDTEDARASLVRYAVMLSERNGIDEVNEAIQRGVGKYSDEIRMD